MSVLARLYQALSGRPTPPSVDREMLDLAVNFRAERKGAMSAEMERREQARCCYLSLKEEVDKLRSYRREADVRMMRHGIELPDDDTD